MTRLNLLWSSKQHGQEHPKHIKYRTLVRFDGKEWLYADEPEAVTSAWESEESYRWERADHTDGTTTLWAEKA